MAGPAHKRRSSSSTNPVHSSSRPHKRARTGRKASGSSEASGTHTSVADRIYSWFANYFSPSARGASNALPAGSNHTPNSSTRPEMRYKERPARGNRVIDVTTLDDDDEEVDPRQQQASDARWKLVREAHSHLNDHVQQQRAAEAQKPTAATPSVHPSLTAPLFSSAFDTPHRVGLGTFSTPQAGPSTFSTPQRAVPSTTTPVAGTSSPRPDVSAKPRHRTYSWARPTSPSSSSSRSSSRSSSGSREGKPLRSRRSHRTLRDDVGTNDQLKMLEKLMQKGNSDDPAVLAIQRVHDQAKADAERTKLIPLSARKKNIEQLLRGLDLDSRVTFDDAIAPPPKEETPRLPTKGRPRPVPAEFKSAESILQAKLKLESLRVQQKLEERFKPSIPADITPDQGSVVDARLRDPSFEASKGSAVVSATSLRRLRPQQWLNDEVVNFYVELINARAKAKGQAVHCMNSYFYQKLSEDGYERANLKRWTKRMKVDIFALDKLLVPINLGNVHWVCAVVDLKRKRIEYYDSMVEGGQRHAAFKHLRGYLQSEHKEKKGSSFDLTGWVDQFSNDTPRQDNGCDCGVFACQTLESAARGRDLVQAGFEFSRKNMPFFRRLMIVEIASGELAVRPWAKL